MVTIIALFISGIALISVLLVMRAWKFRFIGGWMRKLQAVWNILKTNEYILAVTTPEIRKDGTPVDRVYIDVATTTNSVFQIRVRESLQYFEIDGAQDIAVNEAVSIINGKKK